MRALVQRVSRAKVSVDGEQVAAIGPGMLVLLGVRRGDGDDEADLLGVLVIAAVLLLVPLLSQGSALAGLFGAAFGALAGLILAAASRSRA